MLLEQYKNQLHGKYGAILEAGGSILAGRARRCIQEKVKSLQTVGLNEEDYRDRNINGVTHSSSNWLLYVLCWPSNSGPSRPVSKY